MLDRWGEATAATFLRDYWQKAPCLLRGALGGGGALAALLEPYADGDGGGGFDVGALAADAAEAAGSVPAHRVRCVARDGEGEDAAWRLRRAPFAALPSYDEVEGEEDAAGPAPPPARRWADADGEAFPADGRWALLVNELNLLSPDADELIEKSFGFLPRWRVADVQLSYTPAEGGGIGPHADSFDVFLCQIGGGKRWCLARDAAYLPHVDASHTRDLDVRVLRPDVFEAQHTLDLRHGDVLYLPPGVAHRGVAMGEGATLSVGFLAPTLGSMAESFGAAMGRQGDGVGAPEVAFGTSLGGAAGGARRRGAGGERRWEDPWLEVPAAPAGSGALSEAAVSAAQAALAEMAADRERVRDWLGAFVTTHARVDVGDDDADGGGGADAWDSDYDWPAVRGALDEGAALARSAASRAALWTRDEAAPASDSERVGTLWIDGAAVAVGGAAHAAAAAIARTRSHVAGGDLDAALGDAAARRLVVHLVREGLLHVEPVDEEDGEELLEAGVQDDDDWP
eukprot:PRCOL_00006158-RA